MAAKPYPAWHCSMDLTTDNTWFRPCPAWHYLMDFTTENAWFRTDNAQHRCAFWPTCPRQLSIGPKLCLADETLGHPFVNFVAHICVPATAAVPKSLSLFRHRFPRRKALLVRVLHRNRHSGTPQVHPDGHGVKLLRTRMQRCDLDDRVAALLFCE